MVGDPIGGKQYFVSYRCCNALESFAVEDGSGRSSVAVVGGTEEKGSSSSLSSPVFSKLRPKGGRRVGRLSPSISSESVPAACGDAV